MVLPLTARVDLGAVAKTVLCIPQSSRITRASPSDCFVSYLGHFLGESYSSGEMQSVHYTAAAAWANILEKKNSGDSICPIAEGIQVFTPFLAYQSDRKRYRTTGVRSNLIRSSSQACQSLRYQYIRHLVTEQSIFPRKGIHNQWHSQWAAWI